MTANLLAAAAATPLIGRLADLHNKKYVLVAVQDGGEFVEQVATPLPFDVTPATAAGLQELSSEPGELILVDTPPGTAAAIDAAIDTADLVIIPTGPRAADIDRVLPTLDITAHRSTTVLLTLVDMRKLEAVEMPRGLIEANVPVLRNIVRDLTAVSGHSAAAFRGIWATTAMYSTS